MNDTVKKAEAPPPAATKVNIPKPKPARPALKIDNPSTPGATFVFRDKNGTAMRYVIAFIQNNISYHVSHRFAAAQRVPVDLLVGQAEAFNEFIDSNNFNATDSAIFKEMKDVIAAELEARRLRFEKNSAEGRAEFYDLTEMLKEGVECVADFNDELVAGPITGVQMKYTWMGVPYIQVNLRVIHNMNGVVEEGEYGATIGYYEGFAKLDRLPVYPMSAEIKAKLIERGKIFMKFASGVSYLAYSGHLTRTSWFGEKTYRAAGRAMIDVGSFKRVDSDQQRQEMRNSRIQGIDTHDEDASALTAEDFSLTEENCWRTFPYTLGFSFAAKQWGSMRVEELSDINWRNDAFEKLVLDERLKELVKALVSNQSGTFEDLIEGKGGGTIFLLHGPPGEGKTLTAEAIAELLHKPLYSISVGELGIDPKSLELRLREVLDIATVWDAVILIDEADIFLEERDEHNILRNAMVGVFLRLLEYHQGVLFLTTNRVKNIDEAFYSRISVGLHFKKGEDEKRAQIWTNLLAAAKVEGVNVDKLKSERLNGRQIKSAIRLSQTLAKARETVIDDALIGEVIELTTSFERERQKK